MFSLLFVFPQEGGEDMVTLSSGGGRARPIQVLFGGRGRVFRGLPWPGDSTPLPGLGLVQGRGEGMVDIAS